MAIKIDKNLCVGCGRCTEMCPEIFKLEEDGKAKVISESDLNCAMKASDACPVGAIKIDE